LSKREKVKIILWGEKKIGHELRKKKSLKTSKEKKMMETYN